MNGLFLEIAGVAGSDDAFAGAIFALILAFLVVFLIVAFVLWLYLSFAYMAIGKKARLSMPGLAWIPGIGPHIIAFQASKMHWWPWLLLIGFVVPILSILCALVFGVYTVIWNWKMFERIHKPGYWALLCLIPVVNLILIGIAAWSKGKR